VFRLNIAPDANGNFDKIEKERMTQLGIRIANLVALGD